MNIAERAEKYPKSNSGIAHTTAFNMAVYGRGYKKEKIERWFDEYVPKSQYDKNDRTEIIDYAFEISHSI